MKLNTITNRENEKSDPSLSVKNLLESFAEEKFSLTYNPAYPLVAVYHGRRRPPWCREPRSSQKTYVSCAECGNYVILIKITTGCR